MSDPINRATEITKKAATDAATNAKNEVLSKVTNAIPPKFASVQDKISKLPRTKDPELLKAQAKAEAQKLLGEAQTKLQQEKEKIIEQQKDKIATLASLASGAVGLFLKLPILDPKVLATLAFLRAQQEVRELKQKASKDNLKKAKENFTFPMKPPTSLNGIPKIPSVPKIPDLPTVPNVPTIPKLPELPAAPKVPQLPAVPNVAAPSPQAANRIPPGISPEDWKRFGDPDTLSFGPESAAKTVAARKASRRAEIIKIQEDRVRKAKEFVDRQAQRLASDPSLQSSYDTAVKVYNNQVAYLEKVKSNPNIVDLTQ